MHTERVVYGGGVVGGTGGGVEVEELPPDPQPSMRIAPNNKNAPSTRDRW